MRLFHSSAAVGETGKPFSAHSIAGSIVSVSGSLPNFAESAAQAAGAPGTVTVSHP